MNQIDVWKVVEAFDGLAAVLLIPAIVGIVKIWATGRENADKIRTVDGKVDALAIKTQSIETKVDALTTQLAHMSGMIQGKFGLPDGHG